MAAYRCALTVHSRSHPNSASAVTFYAYLTRRSAVDERTGVRVDFTDRAHELAAEGLALPSPGPDWARDAGELWKRHEAAARRWDSQCFRQHQLMIPRGIPEARARVMVELYCSRLTARHRCASWVLHVDDRGDLHAHVIETLREITTDGFGKVFREPGAFAKGRRVNGTEAENIRATWERICNDALQASGRGERVSCLSNFARGLPAPAPKLSRRAYHLTRRVRSRRPGYVTLEELDKAAAVERKHEQLRLDPSSTKSLEIQIAERRLAELEAALNEARAQQPPHASPMRAGGEPALVTTPSHQEISHVHLSAHTAGSFTSGGTASTGTLGQLPGTTGPGRPGTAPAERTGTTGPDAVGQPVTTTGSGVPASSSAAAATRGSAGSGSGEPPFAASQPSVSVSAPAGFPIEGRAGWGSVAPGTGSAGSHATGSHVGRRQRAEDPQDAELAGSVGSRPSGPNHAGASGPSPRHSEDPRDRREDRSALVAADAARRAPEPSPGDDSAGARDDAASSSRESETVKPLSERALTSLRIGIMLRQLGRRLAEGRRTAHGTAPSLSTPLERVPTLQEAWDALPPPPPSSARLLFLRSRLGLQRLGERLRELRPLTSVTLDRPDDVAPLPTLQEAWHALPLSPLPPGGLEKLRIRARLQHLGEQLTKLRGAPFRPAPADRPSSLPTFQEALVALPLLRAVPVAAVARRAQVRAAFDPAWTLPHQRLLANAAAHPLWAATAALPSADAVNPGRVLAWLSENAPRKPRPASTPAEIATSHRPATTSSNPAKALPPEPSVSAPSVTPLADPSILLPQLVEVLRRSGDLDRIEIAARLSGFLNAHPEARAVTLPTSIAASAESARAALRGVQKDIRAARAVSPVPPATSQQEPSQSLPQRARVPTRAGRAH